MMYFANKPRLYYGYYLILAAFLAQFVAMGILSYVAGAFMAPMSDALGWNRAEFTISRSLAQCVMALVGLVIGGYVDRFGGRRLMLLGTAVLCSALFMHAYIHTLWQWWVLNGLLTTVGCALVGNLVVNVTLAKWWVVHRGKAVAWAAMGVSMAGVVLTPLVTWLIDTQGWRATWQWLAVGAALILLPVAAVMRRAPEDHGWHPDGRTQAQMDAGEGLAAAADLARSLTRGQALRTATFYALVIAFSLFTINIVVVLLHAIPLLTDAGFTRTEAALAMTVASVPALLSKPVWGWLIDRLPAQPLAALSASSCGIALMAIALTAGSGHLWWVYGAFFLLGLGWGGMIPMQEVIWGGFFGRRYLGAVRSAGLPFTLAAGAVAPYAVSLYYDQYGDYLPALMTVGVLNVLSGVLIYGVQAPRLGAIPVQE